MNVINSVSESFICVDANRKAVCVMSSLYLHLVNDSCYNKHWCCVVINWLILSETWIGVILSVPVTEKLHWMKLTYILYCLMAGPSPITLVD